MTRSRKFLYGLLVSVALLGLAEAGLRLTGFGALAAADDPYLGFFNDVPLFVTRSDPGGQPMHVMNPARAGKFFPASFPVAKASGTFRIFCLGGSAAQGWPHDPRFSYPTYLGQLLRAAFPERRFEILNLGGHTYATYRILNVLEEVLDYDPDLIVMYEANNEFLEKRYYRDPLAQEAGLQRLNAMLNEIRIYGLLKSVVHRLLTPAKHEGLASHSPLSGDAGREHRRQFALKETLTLRHDPLQFERLREHFAFNVGTMAERCQERGVPFLLATVPVNLADWTPNHSLHPQHVPADVQRECEAHLAAGRAALDRDDSAAALVELDRACALDPEFADARYTRGLLQLRAGCCEAARADLIAAVDCDQLPFRALSSFNAAIRALGERGLAHVVDLEGTFAEHSRCGCPGRELFVDYVHPNMAGNQLIARTVEHAIEALGRLGPPARRDLDAVTLEADLAYYERDESFLRMMGFLHLEFGHYLEALADYRRLASLPLKDERDRPMLIFCRDRLAGYLGREGVEAGRRAAIEADFRSFLEAVVFGTEAFRERYFAEHLKGQREAHAQ